jgi:predicted ArsR family transcriptional regulator
VDLEHRVAGVAALDNSLSRRAYRLVMQDRWVTRDRVAAHLGVARSVAAFHLDKLVEAGLLATRFERVSGRTGPGAGRPAKLYGLADAEVDVSLPPRRYDLAGALLARAVDSAGERGVPVRDAVESVAREAGASTARDYPGRGVSTRLEALLEETGYAPHREGNDLRLLNCPFHKLAQEHRDLVCGMNLCFVEGALDGLGASALEARLEPEDDYCCVRIGKRAR